MKTRILVRLAAAALLAPTTISAQSPPPQYLQPSLRDSTGRVVGPMVDRTGVLLTVGAQQTLVRMGVNTEGFTCTPKGRGCANPRTYHTTTDCSGTKYLAASTVIPFGQRTPSNNIIYPGPVASALRVLSIQNLGESGARCDQTDRVEVVAPIRSVPIDSFGFTPPFKVLNLPRAASPQPTLLDRTGKTVGPMIDSLSVVIDLEPQPSLLGIDVDRQGINTRYNCDAISRLCDPPFLEYRTTDCSGTPYLDASSLIAHGQLTPSTTRVEYPGPDVERLRIKSHITTVPNEGSRCEPFDVSFATVASVRSIATDALGATPPYTVKLQSASPQPILQDGTGATIGPMIEESTVLMEMGSSRTPVYLGELYTKLDRAANSAFVSWA